MLYIHALLWFTNALDLNELVQWIKNDETFKYDLLNYLDDIIVRTLIQQKATNFNETNNYDWDNINPCATVPPNTSDIDFEQIYQRDLYKLINTCNRHVCNPACYKNDKDVANKFCRYGFLHKIINEIHFDNETELLHIKWTDQWINNENPTIMVYCRCNHELKFIATSGKDAIEALVYYITYYITKNTLYTSHMYSLLQVVVQK